MLGYGLAPPLRAQVGGVARTVHPQRQQVPHPHQHRVAGALHDQPVECLVDLEVRPQIALGVVAHHGVVQHPQVGHLCVGDPFGT